MHIVLCSHNAELEGAPLLLLHLATLLKKAQYSVILCTPTKGPLLSLAKEKGIECTLITELYNANVAPEYITKKIAALHPDVVMVNTILGARIIQILSAFTPQTPTILSIHESEFQEIMNKNPHITPDVFPLADAIVITSHATKKVYQEWDTGNMHMIYNSVHMDPSNILYYQARKNELRDSFNIPEESTVISLIGTLCPRKGQKEFIASALHVLEKMSDSADIRFLIAGKLHPTYAHYLQESMQPVIDRGLEDKFYILPESKNPMQYFACTDIYVCNSFIESFPLVILEAMACGLPIAASKTYGVGEQLTHTETGLLHLPGNISQLSENLYTLIKDKALATQLGENAKKTVREQFSQEKMVHAYDNLLNSLF